MEQSILTSTKKTLGVAPDDPSFDLDIITHINSAFSILNDLGVGPLMGFVIEDDSAVWADFISDDDENQKIRLSKVKICVFLRTRLVFDPPTSSYLLEAVKQQLQECEWRLVVNREETEWVDPTSSGLAIVDGMTTDDMVMDGGDPSGV